MRSASLSAHALAFSLLALPVLLGLPTARAQEAPAPPVPMEQLWEEVLLLDALAHLRLSHGQLQQVPALVRTADARLARLREQQEPNIAALERLLARHRDTLLKGRRAPTPEQDGALFLRRTLRGQQARALDQLVPSLAARLARIVRAEQAARAWRLALGDWPERLPRRPALLVPESGFILGRAERDTFREDTLRRALARRFPRALAEGVAASPAPFGSLHLDLASEVSFRSLTRIETGFGVDRGEPSPEALARRARLHRIRAEAERMRARWDEIAAQWVREVSQEELDRGLEFFARRLLCSPRLVPVLEERLGRAAEAREAADRGQRLGDRWEDVLLLDAVRCLLLSPEQMEKVLALGRAAREQTAALEAAAAKIRPLLRQAMLREREVLLAGGRVPEAEHVEVLNARRAERERRERLEAEIGKKLAPELEAALTREQVMEVYLLTRGVWVAGRAKSPMLLDSESGFVLDPAERDTWRDRTIRAVLTRRFGQEDASTALGPIGAEQLVFATVGETGGSDIVLFLDQAVARRMRPLDGAADFRNRFPAAAVEAAERERDRLDERWARLAELLESGAGTADELAIALRPFVRRAFASPRFGPVVGERLRQGTPLPPEERLPPPAGKSSPPQEKGA